MVNPEKEYSISEVAELTGYQAHVLRYYEKEFELDVPRNEANHRYYTYKEIETLNYIKSLQEKGFTNKQIKLILNSPEILVNDDDEAAITTLSNSESLSPDKIDSLKSYIKELIVHELKPLLEDNQKSHEEAITGLRDEVSKLKKEIQSKERDVLLSQNAKLTLKVKEKSYEVAEMRDKIKRLEYSKRGIFSKLFKK
ncbi:MerR family transcriptional regulator [Sporosalibacterium faouarense]|uniref:MerR family transcriptional regulator n=1 Tax=Sporosalibacterium faouarense TaxID=516123 RepID=UPI00141C71E5|nr:MerR family transcriptional regulator [Sporosalibacterium faouarense]MTI48140.1 MerR family transcriptional regulator [Bacillota bacterium]